MYYCSIEQKYIFFIVKKAYTSGVINKYAHLGRGPPRSIGKFAYNKFLFCFKFMYEKLWINLWIKSDKILISLLKELTNPILSGVISKYAHLRRKLLKY